MLGKRIGGSRVLRAAFLAAVMLTTAAPSASAAEPTHLFDAVLSLTGGCGETQMDPIPDPGCPEGPHPPSGAFTAPRGTAVDAYGNRYVASYGNPDEHGAEGRIDVFSPSGEFITEVVEPFGPISIAVDSLGHLYVRERGELEGRIARFDPTVYNPAAGEITYGSSRVIVADNQSLNLSGSIAVNRANDHLFSHEWNRIREFGSVAEGNALLHSDIGEDIFEPSTFGRLLAIDAARGRIYANTSERVSESEVKHVVRIIDLEPPHALLGTIDGSTTPAGRFVSFPSSLPVGVDEESGRVFVGDLGGPSKRIYVFEPDGSFVFTITKAGLQPPDANSFDIAVDNGPTSPTRGYLFVPSGQGTPSRSVAFQPKPVPKPPVVEELSVGGITASEALVRAAINPEGSDTTYELRYTSEEAFQAEGFAGAETLAQGTLKAATVAVGVSGVLKGLEAGGGYRVQVVVQSGAGQGERSSAFSTYRPSDPSRECANEALRTGPSAALPDCRAYELVTPANTNGHAPIGLGPLGAYFATRHASPAGDKVTFSVEWGPIPGFEGTGSLSGDPYLATRGEQGWGTVARGPNGVEAPSMVSGGISPDQGHSFWGTNSAGGTANYEGGKANYVRYPDNSSELVGRGTLDVDPQAAGHLIVEDGAHIFFSSKRRLEEGAPPAGTVALYDRTADGKTHVVSLLPGNHTPEAHEYASFVGASPDGKGVAFRFTNSTNSGPLREIYLRVDNEETYLAAPAGAAYAGVAEGGRRLFYEHEGDLFAFDAETQETVPFSESGDVAVVNVSADGTAAYFASPTVLEGPGGAPLFNPDGDSPQAGEENLYLSRDGQLAFVATLTERDVNGKPAPGGGVRAEGLGLWTYAVETEQPGTDPSRTTPDGSVLLFEARAELSDFDSEGAPHVYRYDAEAPSLTCLSCNPTRIATGHGASLQSLKQSDSETHPLSPDSYVTNLTPTGDRAFFQSTEALVLEDTDGLQDVYEWEREGLGSCKTPGGCVYLISAGSSTTNDYLYAVSDSGEDVFLRTADLLSGGDPDATPSIYDARVAGGFPAPASGAAECLGESCQPVIGPPSASTPGSATFQGQGNVKPGAEGRRCPKGKRLVRGRSGKPRCVPRQKQRKRRTAAKRRTRR